ncbi:MAG: BlaI/MecI/CopY family transcriptional regulator [Vicinamibacterales bacterium]
MSKPTPTDAELGILHILWRRGASTVREVHDAISDTKDVGYTTVLKQMQVMHRKGLLTRSDRFRSHLYEPVQTQAKTQRQLVLAMMEQAFGGSARRLLQSALAGRRIDAQELRDIRALLDEYERTHR